MEVLNVHNVSPKQSRCHIQFQRNEVPSEPVSINVLSSNDASLQQSIGSDSNEIITNEEGMHHTQCNLSKYYKKQLQRKDEEIKKLNRQLESSAKLVKFYKVRPVKAFHLFRR
jgi:hypothetical protein